MEHNTELNADAELNVAVGASVTVLTIKKDDYISNSEIISRRILRIIKRIGTGKV